MNTASIPHMLLAALATTLVAGSAHAQCSVQATTRSVALTWGTGNGDVTGTAGPLQAAPAIATAIASDLSVPREASGNLTTNLTSNYGGFRYTANGAAQTTYNGMFLYCSGSGSISDSILVSSPSLPPGTPVQLRFIVRISGSAAVVDASPAINFYASVGPCLLQNLAGFGTASQDCVASVGSQINWNRGFNATLNANSIAGFGPISSSIAADIEVAYSIESLTPGVVLTPCSNHDYDPPCPADVDNGSGTGTRDGGIGIEDLLYYLALYDSGVAGADVDDGSGTGTEDGGVGIEDLLYYLQRYDAGC